MTVIELPSAIIHLIMETIIEAGIGDGQEAAEAKGQIITRIIIRIDHITIKIAKIMEIITKIITKITTKIIIKIITAEEAEAETIEAEVEAVAVEAIL